nr:glycerophosphoryl diester phosphodiesterase membrane domain-containing protein [Propionicimonas sp.]
MSTSTPLLKPSPLDISGLFSASVGALRRRFGLFLLISLIPTAVLLIVIAVFTAIFVSSLAAAGAMRSQPQPGVFIGAFALLLVGAVVALLAQLKTYGMMSVAAAEIADGQQPDIRGLFARTRGFLPRMAPVIAIVIGAIIAVYVLFVVVLIGMIAATNGRSSSASAVAGIFGLIVLGLVLIFPLSIYLSTKLLYTIPAAAIEQCSGIDAMKRSWSLTRGAFWRTLGYYLLAALVVNAASYVVGMVAQVAVLPLAARMSDVTSGAEVLAALGTMIPVLGLVMLLQLAVQLVGVPFIQAYTTYMFIDQVRRSELPAAPPPGYGGAGYYAQPGQYYGQQPGHPQQGGWYPPQPGGQQWTPPQSGQWQPPQGGPS